jgi:hypothetical protein
MNMTTKKLILLWLMLLVFAGIGNVVYDAKRNGAEAAATKEAPPYVPVSDAVAIAEAITSCRADTELRMQLMLADATCESFYGDPAPERIKMSQDRHHQGFHQAEIYPRTVELEGRY